MPHDPSGPCVVCGTETTQRCSSCAEHEFDLFLCGREHQKLRVCGVNSNPFRFPPLTPDEVDEATQARNEGALFSDGKSLAHFLCLCLDISENSAPDVIARLGADRDASFHPDDASMLVVWVRAFLQELDAASTNDDASSSYYNTFKRTSRIAANVTAVRLHAFPREDSGTVKRLRRPFTNDSPLYTPFFHLVLVYCAIYEGLRRTGYGVEPPASPHLGWVVLTFGIRQRIECLISQTELEDRDVAETMRIGLRTLPSTTRTGDEHSVGL